MLDPRGEELNADNVGSRLAARNLMDELRGTGLKPKAQPPSARNKQDFANQLQIARSRNFAGNDMLVRF